MKKAIISWVGNTDDLPHRLAHLVIIYLVSLVVALPLFIILHPHLPELELPLAGGIRVDHILLFLMVMIASIVLVRRFQLAAHMALVLGMLAITVTSLIGTFTFGDLYNGYADMLRSLQDTSSRMPVASQRSRPFHDADKLRRLVVPIDPDVRKSAVRMATSHFTSVQVATDEHTLVQSLSIFKEINSRWRYVSDVKGGEYFAPPVESIELMAGDCDDHAVLMAAMIKAIGGEVRLVRTDGHVYPEMRIGDDAQLERTAYLIRKVLFVREVGEAPLYHHTDANGVHWINLDYTRPYPGGELMNEGIIGILEL